MKNAPALIFFILALALGVSFTLVILDTSYTEYIGSLSFFYEVQTSNTQINTSGDNQSFSLQRISEQANPYLTITYGGGNASDQVYVNENLIGNLSGVSPDTIIFSPLLLAVDTNVSYVFAGAVGTTNVTQCNLTYYRFDGCNYGETACVALDNSRDMTEPFMYLFGFLPLIFIAFFVIYAVGAVIR